MDNNFKKRTIRVYFLVSDVVGNIRLLSPAVTPVVQISSILFNL